jgi:hypothetical protein
MAKKSARREPQRRDVDRLAGHVTSATTQLGVLLPYAHPLERIRAISRLRFLANSMLDIELEAAREAGYSWSDVGGAAGMSGPGAQRRVTLRAST